ncbi:type VII secretion protein EccC [Virgisporangium ochraceum]|uniref:Type VII secretion protein EccC n=2 Tax=Virgisporangium ochraceum TaxID=65505 RepID=A0A8J3ZPA3_9ACTN|nr:type VII secretion protein EccC [Virgisporangium ochraceum]
MVPSGEVMLEAPPENPPPASRRWQQMLMILPMIAGTMAMGLMMGVGARGPIAYIAGGMYGGAMLGMVAVQFMTQTNGPNKAEMIESRRQYMRTLSHLRAQVVKTITQQREALFYRHPDPGGLWSAVGGARLWERRRDDGDFGVVRIGLGPQEIATPLIPPQTRPVDELEPLCAMALRRFVTTYSIVPDLPVAVALRDFARIYVRGSDEPSRSLVRAIVAQYAAFHAPDDAIVGFCVSDAERPFWEWAKWLPHALHAKKHDGVGPVRLIANGVAALEALLDDTLVNRPRFSTGGGPTTSPHVLVVIDGGTTVGSDHLMTEGGVDGVTVIDLANPPPRLLDDATVVLEVADDGELNAITMDGTTGIGRADVCDPDDIEVLAREMAPLRLSATDLETVSGDQFVSKEVGLADLLELGDPHQFDVNRLWSNRPNRDRLRIPIGVGPDGRPIELDLKESAQEGMGPHGLLVGATGSGKSELLRTLVISLALTHHPETLNFVLVDFKGGATFATLDRLPHTSAVITNLSEELALVDRMLGAISGELTRRQELLRRAGNYASQRDYERARVAGVPLAPLPSLLIICDEFSELLTARPDFIDMFVQIGRVGRSLGIHLLLASQRLDEGRLRGLDAHLSYRLGLRTFSSMESRAVLGVPDAFELPRSPGNGYLKVETGLTRFRAAYVSGVYRTWDDTSVGSLRRNPQPVRDYTSQYVAPPVDETPTPVAQSTDDEDDVRGETLLDVLVARLEGKGVPAHQVWLPPLSDPPTLDQMLPPLVRDSKRGLTVSAPEMVGALSAIGGVVDKPFEQRRDLLVLDLSGGNGNAVVVGAPRSGKSNLVRTLIASLALTHTPQEVQFFALDFGGGGLMAMRDLPHVGTVATRHDVSVVRRTIAEARTIMRMREKRFADEGIDSIATYRRRKRDGEFTDDPFGDLFVVIDGWTTLRNEFDDQEASVTEIAASGLGYGVHLILTSGRWMDMRPAIRDMFGTKLELRLGDAADSMINRREALNVPESSPGRGLIPGPLHFLSGLPRIDGQQDADHISEGMTKLIQAVRNDWSGKDAQGVRLLPDLLPYEAVAKTRSMTGKGLPIGIAEKDLQPVFLDFDAEPHLILFGDVEAGKSSFLRVLAKGITERYPADSAKIMIIDHRRSLLGAVDTPHLIGYGTAAPTSAALISEAAEVMRRRLPGPDVTAEQLRNRNWYKGPDLFLLVDDYDLVATQSGNPLQPMIEFLAQGRDIGLRVIITRRVGGAGRAMFDPVIARIRDLASPGILMSGPRDEGALLGNIKPQLLPPGRGWLVTRRSGAGLVQLAYLPPAH